MGVARRSPTRTKSFDNDLSFLRSESLLSQVSTARVNQPNAKLDNLADELTSIMAKLENCKTRTQEQISVDTKLALQRFKEGKKQDAIELMRSVHKNKQYKEYITMADFELRGMKIELNNNESEKTCDATYLSTQKVQMRRIVEKLNSVGNLVPSDDMLTRKLRRMARAKSMWSRFVR